MFWMKRLFMQPFIGVRFLQIYLSVENIVIRKSRTFANCDIQKMYWCFINITINFDRLVMTDTSIDELY